MMARVYYVTALCILVLSACTTNRVVGYTSDIEPLLRNKCQHCHLPPDGMGYVRTGLSMASYDDLMTGTMFGRVIIPGDSRRSVLNKLVEGRAGEMMRMPHGENDRLTDEEIEILRIWVNQGALNN